MSNRTRTSTGYRLRDDVALTDTDDGGVLLDQRSGQYWQVNDTGYLIITTLIQGGTPRDAATALADRYQISADRAAGDVTALLDSLTTARLVRPA